VPEAVTCDLRLGLGIVDLVGDEQSYLLHCLNTAGYMVQLDTCLCREKLERAWLALSESSDLLESRLADCSNADQSGVPPCTGGARRLPRYGM
jgi:hypothetical protein